MAINVVQTFEFPIRSLIDADTSFFFINADQQLGVSNGTGAGTVVLGDGGDGEDYEGLNGKLFFDGFSSESGEEPFVNDGTPEGNRLLLDINPTPNETSDPLNFIAIGDIVYFTAFDEENGVSLWKTDGTTEGTEIVVDIYSSTGTYVPFFEFFEFDSTLYFRGYDDTNGYGLWRSNGTAEGTQFIENSSGLGFLAATEESLFATSGSSSLWVTDGINEFTEIFTEASIRESEGVGNTLYFSGNDGVTGSELWRSDGTTEGTQLVIDLYPEVRQGGSPFNSGSNPKNLTDVNGTLYFTANDGVSGEELWTSDGTAEGTRLVVDITEGEGSSYLTDFNVIGDTLYFINAGNFETGLWQSDGTEEGTFKIETEEIPLSGNNTALAYTNPDLFIEFNGQLYFTGEAYDRGSGEYVPALLTLEEIDDSIVYRSFNPNVGVHFYTTDIAERDEFLATGNYTDEGASYRAADPTTEGAEEVYRFFNETTRVHLYTTSEVERDSIQANLPDFAFEGTVFNAYETQVEGSIPIYRFFEPTIGVHLYTPSEVERESVAANLPNYNFEGIAYYANPLEAAPPA